MLELGQRRWIFGCRLGIRLGILHSECWSTLVSPSPLDAMLEEYHRDYTARAPLTNAAVSCEVVVSEDLYRISRSNISQYGNRVI